MSFKQSKRARPESSDASTDTDDESRHAKVAREGEDGTVADLPERLQPFVDALGDPFFSESGCLLFNTDCVDALKRLPEGVVDLTVTSPPYNIGKEYEDAMTTQDYIKWCGKWCGGVARATKPNGSFWLNVGYTRADERGHALPISYLMWDQVPMYFKQEVVWHYGAGVACRNMLSPRNEKFLWYIKDKDDYAFNLDDIRDPNVKYPNQRKNGKLRCNPNGKNPSDVWIIPKVTSGSGRASSERTRHPAQFPEAVIERCILASSSPGDVILDPFMGSGTTAVVALKHGRHVVGFETDKGYCQLARGRIRRTLAGERQSSIMGAFVRSASE